MKKIISMLLVACISASLFTSLQIAAAGAAQYYFDHENGIVTDIGADISIGTFQSQFSPGSVKVFSGDSELFSGLMATGQTVRYGGRTFNAVIYGDINGDGRLNAVDLMLLRKYMLQNDALSGVFLEAADISGYLSAGASLGEITALDVMILRKILLGTKPAVYDRPEKQDPAPADESGYDLWLRYTPVTGPSAREKLEAAASQIVVQGNSELMFSSKRELERGVSGLLGKTMEAEDALTKTGAVVIGTRENSAVIASAVTAEELSSLGDEGYLIKSADVGGKKITAVAANTDKGVLYGTFKLLEKMKCEESLTDIQYVDKPIIKWRVIDHWDNWSGSIERGYAGSSIFKWNELPGTVSPRYEDYARANASIGINTVVINNVNTQFDYIKAENLPKIKVIADIFRKYGIRLALTVRFDSPIGLGGLTTADPLDQSVIHWWTAKFNEIYTYIPDFAGVLIKADSEGQPGPSQYHRTHAEGANMFARILEPHGSIVMWRTFVWGGVAGSISPDITLQQYGFFKPWDGQFDENVVVQSKNGPQDFMPREPIAPVIGGMTQTNIGMELQITQEYTGQSTHLDYLVPQWKEYLNFDVRTTAPNADTSKGTTVDKIIDGTVYNRSNTLMAGVSNIGSDTNWTRLELAQANWYGFGRLAWNPSQPGGSITEAWVKMTFGTNAQVVDTVSSILNQSWEIYESYTSPFGMGLTMDNDHFGPDPLLRNNGTYLNTDASGIGHNRTTAGTNAVGQYFPEVAAMYNNIGTCPEELLIWFHHVPYTYVMKSGKTMIQSLYDSHYDGPVKVQALKDRFGTLEGKIDGARFGRIMSSFDAQLSESVKWRDTMVDFYYGLSGIPDEHSRTGAVLLRRCIDRAGEIASSVTVGTEDGQYPQAALDDFNAEIAAAEEILQNSPSDAEALDNARAALTAATDAFYNSVNGLKNVAYKKPVTAEVQGNQNGVEKSHPAGDANDGLRSTRVNATGDNYPMVWTIDLNALYDLENIKIYWYDGDDHTTPRTYTYSLSASVNGTDFTELYQGNNSADQRLSAVDTGGYTGRYVRITITAGTRGRPSFWELEAYGAPFSGGEAG